MDNPITTMQMQREARDRETEPVAVAIRHLSRLPGLGPRSASRAILHLVKRRNSALRPLIEALSTLDRELCVCRSCGNIDVSQPCRHCRDPKRMPSTLVVVAEVGDLWALERAGINRHRYHVLGAPLDRMRIGEQEWPQLSHLVSRVEGDKISEVILAFSASIDAQVTAHYIAERLRCLDTRVTTLARGVPLGGELDYLDGGTLEAAFSARHALDGDDASNPDSQPHPPATPMLSLQNGFASSPPYCASDSGQASATPIPKSHPEREVT